MDKNGRILPALSVFGCFLVRQLKKHIPAWPVSNLACKTGPLLIFAMLQNRTSRNRSVRFLSEATGSDFRHGQSARRVLDFQSLPGGSVGGGIRWRPFFFDVGSLKKVTTLKGTNLTLRSERWPQERCCSFLLFLNLSFICFHEKRSWRGMHQVGQPFETLDPLVLS